MKRSDFDPGPPLEIAREGDGEHPTLVFERTLNHPPEKVWAALTDPAQLTEWSPYTADRDLGEPGEATLTMIDGETRVDLAANVTRAEAPSLLEYSWGGGDHLRWELAPTAEGTRLTLRHTVADPEFLSKAAAGWHICLAVAEHFLDGDPVGPIVGEDATNYGWTELNEAYSEQLARGDGVRSAPTG